MKKTKWKSGALLAPLPPVMVSCGTPEHPNVLTVAWTGIINTIPPKTYISVRPSRYSYSIIKDSGEFVINLATSDLIRAVDFCGVRSGAQIDKFKEMQLTPIPSSEIAAPMIDECPLSMECKVTQIIPLGSHDMFLAEILAVHVDDTLIDAEGKLHLDRCKLAAFAHGEYFQLGEKIGTFGFSVRKKPKKKSAKHKTQSIIEPGKKTDHKKTNQQSNNAHRNLNSDGNARKNLRQRARNKPDNH